MAGSDSLLGAQSADLSQKTLDIIESVLKDTVGSTVSIQNVGSGESKLVQGTGANNESQAVVTQSSTGTVADLTIGNTNVAVDLPANVGLTFEGLNTLVTGNQVNTYFNSLINAVIPSSATDKASVAVKTSLTNATNLVTSGSDANTVVRVVNITDQTSSTSTVKDEIVVKGDAAVKEVFALNLSSVNKNNTVVLDGIDKAVIVGSGTVKTGNTSGFVVGDNSNQSIIGGAGADTLVGGGGSDTLAGGAGADTFGFNSGGSYTISDLGAGDKIAFNIPGVTNFTQLAALVKTAGFVNGNAVYTFVDGSTITLTGINPNSVTADLITFNIV